MKFLNPALVGDVGSMERFLREAEVASKIDSRHVVRILDTGVADGTTSFLVMELLSGMDLAQKLREKKRLGMSASARASIGVYNNEADIDALVRSLGRIAEMFQ